MPQQSVLLLVVVVVIVTERSQPQVSVGHFARQGFLILTQFLVIEVQELFPRTLPKLSFEGICSYDLNIVRRLQSHTLHLTEQQRARLFTLPETLDIDTLLMWA